MGNDDLCPVNGVGTVKIWVTVKTSSESQKEFIFFRTNV